MVDTFEAVCGSAMMGHVVGSSTCISKAILLGLGGGGKTNLHHVCWVALSTLVRLATYHSVCVVDHCLFSPKWRSGACSLNAAHPSGYVCYEANAIKRASMPEVFGR